MTTPVNVYGVRYPSQSAAAKALGITPQAVSARLKKEMSTRPPGRPPTPAWAMRTNARGNVVPKITLPPRVVARLDRIAAAQGLRGRVVLASRAALAGFEMMVQHPPRKYAPPGGAMRQQEDAGVKIELRPADLARIERHAEAVGAPRNVVVAMAVVRGLRAQRAVTS